MLKICMLTELCSQLIFLFKYLYLMGDGKQLKPLSGHFVTPTINSQMLKEIEDILNDSI